MFKLIVIMIFMLLVGIYTIFDAIVFLFVSKINPEFTIRHSERVIKFIFHFVILVSGVRIHVAGLDNIDSLRDEKSYFIISNHRGFFDIISGYILLDKHTGIVAKDSIGRIPLFKYWMKRINCLFLNRNNIRDGMKMVIDAINNINQGISMWVFPEGTRCKSKNPLDLLEFKQGTFKIPEKTDCYILPIAFKNTECAFENQKPFIKSTDIYINIGTPYKISELGNDERINSALYSQEFVKKLLSEEKNGRKYRKKEYSCS